MSKNTKKKKSKALLKVKNFLTILKEHKYLNIGVVATVIGLILTITDDFDLLYDIPGKYFLVYVIAVAIISAVIFYKRQKKYAEPLCNQLYESLKNKDFSSFELLYFKTKNALAEKQYITGYFILKARLDKALLYNPGEPAKYHTEPDEKEPGKEKIVVEPSPYLTVPCLAVNPSMTEEQLKTYSSSYPLTAKVIEFIQANKKDKEYVSVQDIVKNVKIDISFQSDEVKQITDLAKKLDKHFYTMALISYLILLLPAILKFIMGVMWGKAVIFLALLLFIGGPLYYLYIMGGLVWGDYTKTLITDKILEKKKVNYKKPDEYINSVVFTKKFTPEEANDILTAYIFVDKKTEEDIATNCKNTSSDIPVVASVFAAMVAIKAASSSGSGASCSSWGCGSCSGCGSCGGCSGCGGCGGCGD